MFLAAWEGQPEVMRSLIKAGANVSGAAEHDHWTPLHKAAEMGHLDLVQQLIDAGADVNAHTLPDKNFPEGTVPLKVAAKHVRGLLQAHGAVETQGAPVLAAPVEDQEAADKQKAVHDEL